MGTLWTHTGAIGCILLTLYCPMTPYGVMTFVNSP